MNETISSNGMALNQQGKELFTQHGVLVRPLSNWDSSYGTLHIVDYPLSGVCIEWRPTNVSVFVDTSTGNQEDWAVVNTVGQTANYNLSNSPPSTSSRTSSTNSYLLVQIPVSELKTFSVASNGQHITFVQRDGSRHKACFQQCKAGVFVSALKGFVSTTRSHTDKHTYLIADHQEASLVLDQSFAELDLFTENKTDAVWKLVNNLQQRPYETALGAFSKVTDYFLHRPLDQSRANDDIPAEILYQNRRKESDVPVDVLYKNHNSDSPHSALGPSGSDDSRGHLDSYEFILNEGISPRQPLLPPRQLVPRGQPLDVQQWEQFQDEEGRITDVTRVKEIIFNGGIVHCLRCEVWKFLLGLYPWDSTIQERKELLADKSKEYYQMKLQWRTLTPAQENRFSDFRDRKNLIEKDVTRTDRTLPFYAGDSNINLEALHSILMTYVMYNFDLGYVQGMNDLLSPLLVVMQKEVESFWCFVGFMDLVGGNFELDQANMKKQLSQLYCLLDVVEPELASYLERHESSNMYFCFRWLLVIFKREFSHGEIMHLWEVLWTGLPCQNYHLLMCVALLDSQKSVLIENKYGFTEILKHINDLSLLIDLNWMLENAAGIYNQLIDYDDLPNDIRLMIGLPPVEEEIIEPLTPTNEFVDSSEISSRSELDREEAEFEKSLQSQFL